MNKIYISGFLVGALALTGVVVGGVPEARAEDIVGCQQSMPYAYTDVSNPYFANFESVEYLNGYLAIHIGLAHQPSSDERWFPSFKFVDDACNTLQLGTTGELFGIGATNVSLRFSSPTNYTFYDDDTNLPLTCSRCTGTIQSLGDYFKIRLHNVAISGNGLIGDTMSSAHNIKEFPAPVPVLTGTLTKAAACPAMAITGSIVDSYEHANYDSNGFLQYHFHAQPFQQMGDFNFSISKYGADCANYGVAKSTGGFFTGLTGYFSVRFASPTHFDLWNDDTETLVGCNPGCSGDFTANVPPDNQPATYLSVGMSASNGSFTSTAFSVQQLDNIAPAVAIAVSPALGENNTVIRPATFTVTVSATDDDSGVASTVITLDQTAISNGHLVDSSVLSPGTHTITATATDHAGNTATSTLTFTVVIPVNITCTSAIADVNQLYQTQEITKEQVRKHIVKEIEKACKKINDDDDHDDDGDDDDDDDGSDNGDSNKAHEKYVKELNKVLHYIETNGDAISHMTNHARDVITADVQWLIAH